MANELLSITKLDTGVSDTPRGSRGECSEVAEWGNNQ